MDDLIMVGYNFYLYRMQGIKIPIYAPLAGHYIIVGGSGSGKSTSILYWLYKAKKNVSDLYIADFKASREFEGISEHYAEFDACYELIKLYYKAFLTTPEGGNGKIRILLIDEIAGLLTYYSISKEGKQKADEIRQMMSSILMLGRSRKCFLWLSMQRYTASIFPASSGSADNFHVSVGLGKLTVDGRKGLFAGEHFEGEDELQFGQGKGIILIDGQPLRGIIIPKVSKKKLLELLQK
ncbi:MAG: hypothetical protein PUC12_16460 [Clostridiales bacterium]|nr:hypothetical protein [Clostridiales bacterium]